MKYLRRVVVLALAISGLFISMPGVSLAAFSSGSTGADGAFSPTASEKLQIPEDGVFNFTTVNIPSGVTVTFKKNTKNTPVTILATGDVVINGVINAKGSNANYLIPGLGGPGGFDGGIGGSLYKPGRRGQGAGGGSGGAPRSTQVYGGGNGGGGGFGSSGAAGQANYTNAPSGAGGVSYGNERVLPLIGGSGGGGGGGTNKYVGGGGGGGGGSLLVASSGKIVIGGAIYANGGGGANGENYDGGGGGGGSGGSIRLIANHLGGNGALEAKGGAKGTGDGSTYGGTGGAGRIRIETSTISRTAATNPPLSFGYPYVVTPENVPTLKITSVAGVAVPALTGGFFGSPDVELPGNITNPVTVIVSGMNISPDTTVTISAIPEVGSKTSASGTLTGTEASTSASVQLNINKAYPSLLTASVTFELTASLGGPIFVEGEEVKWVRVAASMGGSSSMTYITESGKEVPVIM